MPTDNRFIQLQRFGLFMFALGLPVSHVPAQFGLGLATIGWFLEGVTHRTWQARWHQMFAPLLFYLCWNVLAALISERPYHSIGAVLDNEWPVLAMLTVFWLVQDVETLRRILFAFLGASTLAMLYGVWQVFGGVEYYRALVLDTGIRNGFYRAVGFYSFYLTFAAFAMTVFFYASALSLQLRRWFHIALAALSGLAVVGTFARSIWIALAVSAPLFAFTRSRKMGMTVSVTLLGIIIASMVAVPALRLRALSIFDVGQNETRLNLWKTAVKVAEDHPVFGVGEDNWDAVVDRYKVPGFYDTTVHPHNDYLTVLVSSGMPGLIAFVGMWGVVLVSGFRLVRASRGGPLEGIALGSTFAIVGLMLAGLFQNYYGTFINCLGWWFVAGLLLSAEHLKGNSSQAPPS